MNSKIDTLERKRKELSAQIRKARKEQERLERQQQQRKETVIGRLVLEAITREPNSDYATWVESLITKESITQKEQALFELPSISVKPGVNDNANSEEEKNSVVISEREITT